MYLTDAVIKEVEARFGVAQEIELQYEIDDRELALVRGSRKHQRSHDITMFIFADDAVDRPLEQRQLVVIRKPGFPAGAYRAPSGGVKPGERVEDGAKREAYEETGLDIELERYLLRVCAVFTHGPDVEPWVTHIFSARVVAGNVSPIDTEEIEDARIATVAELQGHIRDILLGSRQGLFAYRVALTDATIDILRRLVEQEIAGRHSGGIDAGD